MSARTPAFSVLSGGVGGARLVLGLRDCLPAGALQVIVNTGDDFEHLGLPVCPDIDTVLYTLAGEANPETGWGRREESWHFMTAFEQLGGETWFRLGDRDLAMHIRRREMLDRGATLSATTAALAGALGIDTPVHPMSDQRVRTRIATHDGELDFQDYFVRRRAEPVATAIRYAGAASAAPAPGALAAITQPGLAGIIISPSNPWLSIDPMLAIEPLKSTILKSRAPVVAVSPIIAGRALKGPAAKLMEELGTLAGVVGIAEHYRGIIDGLVIDTQDAHHRDAIAKMGIQVAVTDTIMKDLQSKIRLAEFVTGFTRALGGAA